MDKPAYSNMSLGRFTPGHIDHFNEVGDSIEHLKKLGSVWISPDIAIQEPTVINPVEYNGGVHVMLSKKDLPPRLTNDEGSDWFFESICSKLFRPGWHRHNTF